MTRRTRGVLLCGVFVACLSSSARAALLAKVEPGWSPFLTTPVLGGSEGAELVSEARGLFATQPARVAEILARQPLPNNAAGRIARGLRADALYQAGLKGLPDAQKLYREVVTSVVPPAEEGWAQFMLGNIRTIQGLTKEAEVSYRMALKGAEGPWRAAAVFDLGVLLLDAGRRPEARDTFQEWLRRYASEPGRPLVLSLLAEAHARLGETEQALARFAEARAADPNAWVVRPETGYLLAEVFRRAGNLEEAVRVLDAVPRAHPGTLEGAKAHLTVGRLREAEGNVEAAVRAYGQLLDEGATPDEGQEALLRLALLGAEYNNRVRLRDSYPAYRTFYRPEPTLEETSKGKEPARSQQALRGLGLLAQRDGKSLDALRLYARAFQQSAKSAESGRAYESFATCLEGYLTERAKAGKPMDVVTACETFRDALGWSPDRDKGPFFVPLAEAYRALGAPRLAREVYEKLLREGTRTLSPAELEARLVALRAQEGDPAAVRAVAARRAPAERDAVAEVSLARKLESEGRVVEARDHFLRAADFSPEPAARVALMAEADLLADTLGRTDEHLKGLGKRGAVVGQLPAGKNRESWQASSTLAEGRLRFARGDYAGTVKAYAKAERLGPDDTYLLALAQKRLGHEAEARALFATVVKGADPILANLAGFYLKVSDVQDAARGRR